MVRKFEGMICQNFSLRVFSNIYQVGGSLKKPFFQKKKVFQGVSCHAGHVVEKIQKINEDINIKLLKCQENHIGTFLLSKKHFCQKFQYYDLIKKLRKMQKMSKQYFISWILHCDQAHIISEETSVDVNDALISILQLDQEMSTHSTEMTLPTAEVARQAVRLTAEHIPSVKECLIAGFLQKNDIWGAFNIKRQTSKPSSMGLFEIIWNYKLFMETNAQIWQRLDQGSVTSCKMNYDLEDYIEKQKHAKPEQFQLFRSLQKAGKQLTKDIKLDKYPRGETAFINFGGINPAFNISNLMKVICFIQLNQLLKISGYQWVVGRLFNARAMSIYKKVGSNILNDVTFEHEGRKFKLFFFELNLYGETFLKWENNLSKLIQMEKQQIKQSKL